MEGLVSAAMDVHDQNWLMELVINLSENFVDEDQVVFQSVDHETFNQHWSFDDILQFNKILIDECVVSCRWVDQNGIVCNETLKGKELKAHLNTRHAITSDLDEYPCCWDGCDKPAMKKSSLERHAIEQHVPVGWGCPYCDRSFTRARTLLAHVQREPDTHSFA